MSANVNGTLRPRGRGARVETQGRWGETETSSGS
jgi:hypothetical protein